MEAGRSRHCPTAQCQMCDSGESEAWLVEMLGRMRAELDPSGFIFAADSNRILARAALSHGVVLVAEGTGCLRVKSGWRPKAEPRAVLCGRVEDLPLRKDRRVLFIDAAFTEPAFRRQGIMRSLVLAALDITRTEELDGIALGVLETAAAARQFWTAMGFFAVSTRFERFRE